MSSIGQEAIGAEELGILTPPIVDKIPEISSKKKSSYKVPSLLNNESSKKEASAPFCEHIEVDKKFTCIFCKQKVNSVCKHFDKKPFTKGRCQTCYNKNYNKSKLK